MMDIDIFITISILILAKIFIAIWVYRDAKERDLNAFLWTMLVLVVSGSLVFLLYMLVGRKEKNVKCENCSFIQTDKLLYCGRCGSEIKIDRYDDSSNKNNNNIFLKLSIIFLIVGIISGTVITFKTAWKEINVISIMAVSSKYDNTWKDKFKYRNGEMSHSFNIKEKTTLNASWDINNGYLEAKVYKDDILIKEMNSKDNPIYEESIDLSEYIGEKVVLKIKFEKSAGKIEFLLE